MMNVRGRLPVRSRAARTKPTASSAVLPHAVTCSDRTNRVSVSKVSQTQWSTPPILMAVSSAAHEPDEAGGNWPRKGETRSR